MRAIIMAGGEGTRLRPVSLGQPKPMVSLMDKPVLAHILALLRKNGVTKACLTLRYMPEIITSYIAGCNTGIELTSKIESAALGTAGGVKGCSDFIGGEDFLVISGDCICDFDLKSLMDFHKSKNADVTIALYEHNEPLEYGLVVTRPDGRIEKFIEKPAWEGVVTNKINTGIYIISPKVLAEIPPDRPYDFGKELFPALLAGNRALFGLSMSGYWCDIGSPGAYLKCCGDILDGKVRIDIGAPAYRDGVYTLSPIPRGVTVIPPVYIGNGAVIKPGAVIGPRTVIGATSSVSQDTAVRESVVIRASILEGAQVTGAIVCGGSLVGRGADIREDAVIGEGCVVGNNSVIAQSVKLWPERRIPDGSFIRSSITRGMLGNGLSFTSPGVISGSIGIDITPAAGFSLGEAAAVFSRVGIGWQGSDSARVIAEAISCGVCANGGELIRFDSGLASCLAFAGGFYRLPLSICVNHDGDIISITFIGKNGMPLPYEFERKLITPPDGGKRPYTGGYGGTESVTGIQEAYSAAAARYAESAAGSARTHMDTTPQIAVSGGGAQNRALNRALSLLGYTVTGKRNGVPCFTVGDGGFTLAAVDEKGRTAAPERLFMLASAIELLRGRRELFASSDAPAALDTLARRHGAKIIRTPRGEPHAEASRTKPPSLRDGVFMGALICEWMRVKDTTLSELLTRELPEFSFVSRKIPLSRARADIMGDLSAAACEMGVELDTSAVTGVKLHTKNGVVQISPLRGENAVSIRSEGLNEEIAQELCAEYTRRVSELDKR